MGVPDFGHRPVEGDLRPGDRPPSSEHCSLQPAAGAHPDQADAATVDGPDGLPEYIRVDPIGRIDSDAPVCPSQLGVHRASADYRIDSIAIVTRESW